MKRLKILLSFDHELSLGGVRSYAKNLFIPTDKLITLANELSVPITLFTDVLCAIRFKEWDENGFFQKYRNQIFKALHDNHDVQLHLHPHWLDSDFKDGKFVPAKSFALSDFSARPYPYDILGIVKQGVDFISECCRQVYSEYVCIAYRAGGYNLAPETSTIISALYDNGIRIDSSIAKGYYFESQISTIDFCWMPARANWYIARLGPIEKEASSGLYEVPIAASPRNPINNLPFLMKRVLRKNRCYDSGGREIHEGNTSPWQKISRLFPRTVWMLGFDNYAQTVTDLLNILCFHVNNHPTDEEIICSAISHPKNMGKYNFKLMKGFVEEVRRVFEDKVEFCTYRQIYDTLALGSS